MTLKIMNIIIKKKIKQQFIKYKQLVKIIFFINAKKDQNAQEGLN